MHGFYFTTTHYTPIYRLMRSLLWADSVLFTSLSWVLSRETRCIPVECVPYARLFTGTLWVCLDSDPPGGRSTGLSTSDAYWKEAAPPPVKRMTPDCENIILSHTSYTGGKYGSNFLAERCSRTFPETKCQYILKIKFLQKFSCQPIPLADPRSASRQLLSSISFIFMQCSAKI